MDDRRGGCGHVLHARPLAHGVVLLPAREEVRRRKSLRGEHGAVRSAPRDREPRLDAGAPDRLERGLDDTRVLLDEGAHVAVRVAHLDLDVCTRLTHLDLLGELLEELDVLCEKRVVVIARDEVDDRLFRVAGDAMRMDVALAAFGRLGRQVVRRQRENELRGELDGVHELVLRRTGVHGQPADRHAHRRGGERLDLELAEVGAVERVRDVRAESLEIEVLGASTDLLVDREGNANRRPLPARRSSRGSRRRS